MFTHVHVGVVSPFLAHLTSSTRTCVDNVPDVPHIFSELASSVT
jgi:hypothetical protein